MRIVSFAVLFLGLLIAAHLVADTPRDTEIKKDIDQFQGKWKVVSIEEAGKQEPADEVAKFEVTIKANLFSVAIKDSDNKEMTITLDPTQKPATIDMKPKDAKAATVLGIYRLEGDTITIAGTDENKVRPTEFVSGKGITLVVLKRVK